MFSWLVQITIYPLQVLVVFSVNKPSGESRARFFYPMSEGKSTGTPNRKERADNTHLNHEAGDIAKLSLDLRVAG